MRSLRIAFAALAFAAGPAWSDETKAVSIDNFTFSPSTLTVSKGAEVTFTNKDDIPHTIVLTKLGVRSKTLDTDQTFAFKFDKAGTYDYICGLHPHMHGKVIVK